MYCLLFHFPVRIFFTLVDISLAGLQNLSPMNSEKRGFPPWHIPVVHDSFVNSVFSYDKKGPLGSVLLRPPHSFINLWIYVVFIHTVWRHIAIGGDWLAEDVVEKIWLKLNFQNLFFDSLVLHKEIINA